MNALGGKTSGQLAKENNGNKSTKIKEIFIYINTDLYNPTNILFEEYIEKINKECEFSKEMDFFYFYNCLISTQ